MNVWMIYGIGFTAQILFSGRSILQWALSEKNQRVITPILFWQLSLIASFLLFVYGYLRNDFAIMLGQILTYFIYIRNMHFQKQWFKFPKIFSIRINCSFKGSNVVLKWLTDINYLVIFFS